jgi:hypothetical protein
VGTQVGAHAPATPGQLRPTLCGKSSRIARRLSFNARAPHDDAFVKRFAGPAAGAATFENMVSEAVAVGTVPELATYKLVERVDTGDQWLYLVTVVDGARFAERAPYAHIRKNGLQ